MNSGIFDLILDVEESKCPICDEFVNPRPDVCGFHSTNFSFAGIKRDSVEDSLVKINE